MSEELIKIPEPMWKETLGHLKMSLPDEQERNRMDRYFAMFTAIYMRGDTCIINVPGQLEVDLFTPIYAQSLTEAFKKANVPVAEVKFEIEPKQKEVIPVPSPKLLSNPDDVVETKTISVAGSRQPLHENYTFKNFVVGPSNSFAHAASIAVAKGPGRTSYNPLFIYGGTGLGKTHLMEAIGHHVREIYPHLSVCYISSETFLNDYVVSLTNQSLPAFREKYRKFDVLLLDDVQFLAGKEKIREEFFHCFNALIDSHKQVVMTCDVAPRYLNNFDERLISRFQQGMSVEIELPSYETRLAILKFKTSTLHKIVPEEILRFIAEKISSHVRALEGALNRVITFMELNRELPLTVEIASHLLKDSIEEEKNIKDLTVQDIMKAVAEYYQVSIEDIKTNKRTQTLVTPRQVAMFLSRKLTVKSFPEIAAVFDKTHATVHHGVENIQKLLGNDNEMELRTSIDEITTKLGRSPSELT